MKYLDKKGRLKQPEIMSDEELWGYIKHTLKALGAPPYKDSDIQSLAKNLATYVRISLICARELKFRMSMRR